MIRVLLIAVLFGCAESWVDFTHSVLYDQYDIFQPHTTTFVNTLCKSGCSIYASIPPDTTDALKEARNVVIADALGEKQTTLFDIAGLYDETTSQKKSFDFPAKQRVVSIWYSGNVTAAGPILLYVFSNTGRTNIPFEVYEARTMNRKAVAASIVTILSPEPFTVGTEATQLGNTVYAYAAGMDNAIGNGGADHCVKVFELRDQGSFPGFVLNVQFPLLSFYFNMDTPVQFYTRIEYSTTTGFDQFLSSPGFNGCYGMQVYRSSLYADSMEHTVSSEKVEHVIVDATLNTNEGSPVEMLDVTNNNLINLWGDDAHKNAQQSLTLDTKMLQITWQKEYPRSAFLLRFTTDSSPNINPNPPTTTSTPTQPTTSHAVRYTIGVSFLITVLARG